MIFFHESLVESDNLPDPDVLAQVIVEDLEAALEQFCEIAMDWGNQDQGLIRTTEVRDSCR